MKRRIAWILAILSGLYLLIVGRFPIPFRSSTRRPRFLIFVKSMAYLGYDVRKWVPFLGKGKTVKPGNSRGAASQTVDVEISNLIWKIAESAAVIAPIHG